MNEPKVRITDAPVEQFLCGVENEKRRSDAAHVLDLMRDVTGLEPKMWGPSMVGFGSFHAKYESGHEGDKFRIGFLPRKANLVLDVDPFERHGALMQKLGKHTIGKSCLSVNKVEDMNLKVLRELIGESYVQTQREYRDSYAVHLATPLARALGAWASHLRASARECSLAERPRSPFQVSRR